MSGIIGHTMYAILAAKASDSRRLSIAPVIHRHFPSYLAGAYLGCDVQTMPSAICVDTREEVGHGPSPIEKSPLTGGSVLPWKFRFQDREIPPREIHNTFYGRAHLILGWQGEDRSLTVPFSDMLDYLADVAGDAVELFGPGHRSLAYVFGWITHVMGDGLIKSVIDGIHLNLLDGTYTAKNRPVQDLVTFHEIGIRELGLDWSVLLDEIAAVPVEEVQLHYMRCLESRGRLGAHFEEGWKPDHAPLLRAVLAENRRYQRIRNRHLIRQLAVQKSRNGELVCDGELSRRTGGLRYREMVAAAEDAKFREALWQMGEIIASTFEKVIARQERLQELPESDGPTWEALTNRWLEEG